MSLFDVLTMIGGLALFLYGMNMMGDGLERASGGRLEKILEKLTSNRLIAVLLGAAVTAVIQSSSATTVMVVGFVNSGIMKLSQAIGIIMGANIGTTATSWILSLSGIESESFLIQLLKPTSFSPVLAIIGIVLLMFCKSEKKHNVGTIMVGFAVLMFGMDTMSGAVSGLKDVPEFTNILTMFSNPVLGMLAGLILTAIIQSSSASVGILQALCSTGSVAYATALPIIMGQNIGTCVTALISAIGANKNAKRAALVHLYFNLIGTIVFMVLFYSVNVFIDFAFLNDAANAAGIAVIHSIFNVFATLLLLPFAKGLEKLACLTIRDSKEDVKVTGDSELQFLDARFLNTPSYAIDQCHTVVEKMAEISEQALCAAVDLMGNYSEEQANYVVELENKVDKYEDEIGTYLVKLSSQDLSKKDSKTLSLLLHCIGDLERISDHAVNIMEVSKEMNDKGIVFSSNAKLEIQVFSDLTKEIVKNTVNVFVNADTALARSIEPLEEVADHLNSEIKKRHINRLRNGECTIELGFVLTDLITNYERVADHCSNIAVDMIQINEDAFENHEYLYNLDKGENSYFREKYLEYREKYALPQI